MEPNTVAIPATTAQPLLDASGKPLEPQVDWAAKAKELEDSLKATQTSLDALKTDSDRNLRRLQGTYQGQINSLSAQSEEEKARWEDAFHREKMAGMEEAEALRYDNQRLASLVQDREGRMATMQRQAADAQQAAGYLQQFTSLGVPASRLNTSGSLQDLADSGWAGLQEVRALEKKSVTEYDARIAGIQSQLDAMAKGVAPVVTDPNLIATRAGDLTPPNVATHTHGDQTTPMTELQALDNAAKYFNGVKPTLEQLYRAVETKQLPPTVLPGLEGMPKEE